MPPHSKKPGERLTYLLVTASYSIHNATCSFPQLLLICQGTPKATRALIRERGTGRALAVGPYPNTTAWNRASKDPVGSGSQALLNSFALRMIASMVCWSFDANAS